MKTSLKTKMILFIWGITAFILSGLLYYNFRLDLHHEISNLQEMAVIHSEMYSHQFEEMFSKSSLIAQMNAAFLETESIKTEEKLKNYLQNVVKKNKNIYGAAIAFEPYGFNPDVRDFSPYYYNKKDGSTAFVQLGTSQYNYYEKEWYDTPKQKDKGLWTCPYLDEGGGEILMSTYSQPFYRNGVFWGIATVDISLENLTNIINAMTLRDSGYAFIINQEGHYLAFPDKSKILNGSLFNANKSLAKAMTQGEKGYIKTFDPLRKEQAWIIYNPIETDGLILGFVYPEKEILSTIYMLQLKSVFTGGAGLVLLLIVIMILSDSIAKPVSTLTQSVKKVAEGDLNQEISIDTDTKEVRTLEESFNRMIRSLKEYIEGLNAANEARKNLFVSSIRALANAVEARDQYTRGHSDRVTEFSVKIARRMNLSEEEIEKVRYAALLHDIGKIKIRGKVLNKPGRLTEEEFGIMKQHPVHGADIMEPVKEFNEMLPGIYHHHENFDGSGYPEKLKGEEIPLISRIIAAADTYDAMTSSRPYRKALSLEIALEEIEKKAGTQFDPNVAKVFAKILRDEREWVEAVMERQDTSSIELEQNENI